MSGEQAGDGGTGCCELSHVVEARFVSSAAASLLRESGARLACARKEGRGACRDACVSATVTL